MTDKVPWKRKIYPYLHWKRWTVGIEFFTRFKCIDIHLGPLMFTIYYGSNDHA